MTDRPASTVSPEEAYSRLVGRVSPHAPREEMESAIAESFRDVPGFEEAYKESVKLDGQWYDLVGSYGGDGASFHGLMPKVESGGGYGSMGMMSALTRPMQTRMASANVPARAPTAPLPTIARAAYVPLAVSRPTMSDLLQREG